VAFSALQFQPPQAHLFGSATQSGRSLLRCLIIIYLEHRLKITYLQKPESKAPRRIHGI
jgi:hypothetical protein